MNVTERLKFSPYAPVRYQKQPWWIFSENAARDGWVVKDGRVADHFMDKIQDELVMPSLQAFWNSLNRSSQTRLNLAMRRAQSGPS